MRLCGVYSAMEVLEGALRLYKPEEIAMSFNGGKVRCELNVCECF